MLTPDMPSHTVSEPQLQELRTRIGQLFRTAFAGHVAIAARQLNGVLMTVDVIGLSDWFEEELLWWILDAHSEAERHGGCTCGLFEACISADSQSFEHLRIELGWLTDWLDGEFSRLVAAAPLDARWEESTRSSTPGRSPRTAAELQNLRDACVLVLQNARRPLSSRDIAEYLADGSTVRQVGQALKWLTKSGEVVAVEHFDPVTTRRLRSWELKTPR